MASETALILLAAGGSSRMGSPKQLLAYGGRPLLRHAAKTALASACDPVVVVLGAHLDAVGEVLAGLAVEIVINHRWAEGIGTSIRAGVEAAKRHRVDAAILALADQPLVGRRVFDDLLAARRESGRGIIASRYENTVGVPALFARSLFPQLLALPPDQGCKGVILAHAADAVFVACPQAAIDVDTRADYLALAAAPHAIGAAGK